MNTKLPSRIALAFSASAVAALVLVAACSSSGSTSGAPSDSAVCSALAKAQTTCVSPSESAACTKALVDQLNGNCSEYASVLSDAFKNALTTCPLATACPSGDPFLTPCFASTGSVVTATQTKLADDYCALCASAASETTASCVGAFWGNEDGGVPPGPGAQVLTYSDAIFARIESTCIPALDGGAAACGTPFAECAGKVVDGLLPTTPAACLPTPFDAGPPFAGDGG